MGSSSSRNGLGDPVLLISWAGFSASSKGPSSHFPESPAQDIHCQHSNSKQSRRPGVLQRLCHLSFSLVHLLVTRKDFPIGCLIKHPILRDYLSRFLGINQPVCFTFICATNKEFWPTFIVQLLFSICQNKLPGCRFRYSNMTESRRMAFPKVVKSFVAGKTMTCNRIAQVGGSQYCFWLKYFMYLFLWKYWSV